MGNYHVRFGKGVDNYTLPNTKFNAKSVSTLVHYNSIITAHAILMIFFMVEKSFNMLNMKPQLSLYANMVIEDNHGPDSPDVKISKNNNEGDKKSKHKYVKVLVKDPFNNRDLILKVTKKQFSS